MTGWTLFFVTVGVAYLTAQLFRLVNLIEHPAHRPEDRPSQAARLVWNFLRKLQWMFWRN